MATAPSPSPLPALTDWFSSGMWFAFDPAGTLLPHTFGDTAYSARACLAQQHNLSWSKAEAAGYTIRAVAPIAEMARKRT